MQGIRDFVRSYKYARSIPIRKPVIIDGSLCHSPKNNALKTIAQRIPINFRNAK